MSPVNHRFREALRVGRQQNAEGVTYRLDSKLLDEVLSCLDRWRIIPNAEDRMRAAEILYPESYDGGSPVAYWVREGWFPDTYQHDAASVGSMKAGELYRFFLHRMVVRIGVVIVATLVIWLVTR